jgi:hypothetical protein
VRHGAYTQFVPTSHPRHTITETPPVREALDDLRARLAGQRIDFAELVVLGAGVKVRQLPDDAAAACEASDRLATMVRTRRVPVDVEAADEVKHFSSPCLCRFARGWLLRAVGARVLGDDG